MSAMEPHHFTVPPMWAEKHLAPLLRDARSQGGSVCCHVGRVEYDANAPDKADVGMVQIVACVVPAKFAERLRGLILAERAKLQAKEAETLSKNAPPNPTPTTP